MATVEPTVFFDDVGDRYCDEGADCSDGANSLLSFTADLFGSSVPGIARKAHGSTSECIPNTYDRASPPGQPILRRTSLEFVFKFLGSSIWRANSQSDSEGISYVSALCRAVEDTARRCSAGPFVFLCAMLKCLCLATAQPRLKLALLGALTKRASSCSDQHSAPAAPTNVSCSDWHGLLQ